MTALTCWFMTTGEAGFRSQARGLARALAEEPRELIVGLKAPWNRLPVALTPNPLTLLDPARDRPAPPWPDLLITCGRRTAALSTAIRKASGGGAFTAHIQDPLASPAGFDLVIAMAHDAVSGRNVIKVATALHDVTPAKLSEAAAAWPGRLPEGEGPLAGVLLGGPTRRRGFGQSESLIEALKRLRLAARLAIVPSRRTPPDLIAALEQAFAGDLGAAVWNGEGDNPYLGVLALADRLVVTSDSVSMISEALATPHPVEVFGEAQNPRHAKFLQRLMEEGQIVRFTGGAAPARSALPVDATAFAAQTVRRMLAERTGVSG